MVKEEERKFKRRRSWKPGETYREKISQHQHRIRTEIVRTVGLPAIQKRGGLKMGSTIYHPRLIKRGGRNTNGRQKGERTGSRGVCQQLNKSGRAGVLKKTLGRKKQKVGPRVSFSFQRSSKESWITGNTKVGATTPITEKERRSCPI